MLNKKIFMTKTIQIAELKGLNLSENYAKSMYNLIKDDFTDEEFTQICNFILKNEELYNKMPEPRHFYKHKTQPKQISSEEEASVQWEMANGICEGKTNSLTNKILDSMGDNYGSWRWRMNPEHPHHTPANWLRKEFIERYTAAINGEQIIYVERERARNNLLNDSNGDDNININNTNNINHYTEYENKPISLADNMKKLLNFK